MTAVPMTASAATRPALLLPEEEALLLPEEALLLPEEALLLPVVVVVVVSQISWQSDRVVKRFPLPEQPLYEKDSHDLEVELKKYLETTSNLNLKH